MVNSAGEIQSSTEPNTSNFRLSVGKNLNPLFLPEQSKSQTSDWVWNYASLLLYEEKQ